MNDSISHITDFVFPTKYLPPLFSNSSVLEIIDTIYTSLGSFEDLIKIYFDYNDNTKKITSFNTKRNLVYNSSKGIEPINFTTTKMDENTRTFSVANPLILLTLHYYLLENHTDILAEQEAETDSYISNSKFSYKENEIYFDNNYNGEAILDAEYLDPENLEDDYPITTERILEQPSYLNAAKKSVIKANGGYFRLQMDISNFFNNIYTHSISWDLKNAAKRTMFENLDILTRTLNSNETKGIITGPYTSNLFSEIILSKIDKVIVKKCEELEISYVRYCDDFSFYGDSEEDLKKIQFEVEKELSKYRLDINPNKTKITEFPFYVSEFSAKKVVKSLEKMLENENINQEEELELMETIVNSLENGIKNRYTDCNYILRYLISTFDYKFKDEDHAEILLDYLINMLFKYDIISKNLSELIIKVVIDNNIDKEKMVTKLLKKKKTVIKTQKDITEIFISYIIIKMNVVNNEIIDFFKENILKNELVSIIALEFIHKNNLVIKLKKEIVQLIKKMDKELNENYGGDRFFQAYYSRYWLFLFRNYTKYHLENINGFKGILKKYMIIDDPEYVTGKLKIFKILKDQDVNFIEDI